MRDTLSSDITEKHQADRQTGRDEKGAREEIWLNNVRHTPVPMQKKTPSVDVDRPLVL